MKTNLNYLFTVFGIIFLCFFSIVYLTAQTQNNLKTGPLFLVAVRFRLGNNSLQAQHATHLTTITAQARFSLTGHAAETSQWTKRVAATKQSN